MFIFSATENQYWSLLKTFLSYEGKNNHATLVMSKLQKFYLNILKVEWSIGCLEPRSFGWNVIAEYMPSKMIYIHLQTFKNQLFKIQIMKNFEVSFWHEFSFVLILEPADAVCFEFWILAGRKSNTPRSNFIQNFQKMPQFTKQIQKCQNFYSRNWLTRTFWGCLGLTVQHLI